MSFSQIPRVTWAKDQEDTCFECSLYLQERASWIYYFPSRSQSSHLFIDTWTVTKMLVRFQITAYQVLAFHENGSHRIVKLFQREKPHYLCNMKSLLKPLNLYPMLGYNVSHLKSKLAIQWQVEQMASSEVHVQQKLWACPKENLFGIASLGSCFWLRGSKSCLWLH